MNLIVSRVEGCRGDCRLAIDYCRKALHRHLKVLADLRDKWSLNNEVAATELEKLRVVSVNVANDVTKDLDSELGKQKETENNYMTNNSITYD